MERESRDEVRDRGGLPMTRVTGAILCVASLVLAAAGCGTPSDPGPQDQGAHDAASVDMSGPLVDTGVADAGPDDAGPINGSQPCTTDDDCATDRQCGATHLGVRVCVPVGPVEEGERCGIVTEVVTQQCIRGLLCDLLNDLQGSLYQLCRPPCQTHQDCDANEACVTDTFPGEGGLCVPGLCDFDRGLMMDDVAFELDITDTCACLPWELAGTAFERRDTCVRSGDFDAIGDTCGDVGWWCNARGTLMQQNTGVAGVCTQQTGEPEPVCRQVCRQQADCAAGSTCTDVTETLGVESLERAAAVTEYWGLFTTISVCVPD